MKYFIHYQGDVIEVASKDEAIAAMNSVRNRLLEDSSGINGVVLRLQQAVEGQPFNAAHSGTYVRVHIESEDVA